MTEDKEQRYEVKLEFKRAKRSEDTKCVSQLLKRINDLMRTGNRQGVYGRKPKKKMAGGRGAGRPSATQLMQRCSVRLTYAANKGDGQWRAHGRYIARESANSDQEKDMGFGHAGAMPIADTLDRWQNENDERLFKLILSPEFGDQMDMKEQTYSFMKKLEHDLGVPLEWVAIDHYNTDHPHVHIALRGRDGSGQALKIDPTYIRTTLRQRAQESATEQLGIRTEHQIQEALDKQVTQQRYTDLDRMILKKSIQRSDGFHIDFNDHIPENEDIRKTRIKQIRRLAHLEKLGLAERTENMAWKIDLGFETALRNLQMSNDRLKTMYRNRQMLSDPRLSMQVSDMHKIERIAGRLIATGLDEFKDQPYLLIEGVDGKVHYLYQTHKIQEARANDLKIGDFVVIQSADYTDKSGQQKKTIKFTNLGNAESLLSNKKYFESEAAREVHTSKRLPGGVSFGGWLGSYQQLLKNSSDDLIKRGIIKSVNGQYEVGLHRLKREKQRGKSCN